jgi:hypothetical protein
LGFLEPFRLLETSFLPFSPFPFLKFLEISEFEEFAEFDSEVSIWEDVWTWLGSLSFSRSLSFFKKKMSVT